MAAMTFLCKRFYPNHLNGMLQNSFGGAVILVSLQHFIAPAPFIGLINVSKSGYYFFMSDKLITLLETLSIKGVTYISPETSVVSDKLAVPYLPRNLTLLNKF